MAVGFIYPSEIKKPMKRSEKHRLKKWIERMKKNGEIY
jgi:hypothetical protein